MLLKITDSSVRKISDNKNRFVVLVTVHYFCISLPNRYLYLIEYTNNIARLVLFTRDSPENPTNTVSGFLH